jgi:hypothetical protein
MRVATVFTGIASAAAFAAPANAQATATLRPALRAAGHTSSCYDSTHYFAMSYRYDGYYGDDSIGYECVGGVGPTAIVPFSYRGFCGGNNVGYFSGTLKDGRRLTDQRFHQSSYFYHFKPPRYSDSILKISRVYISAWTGSEECINNV